MGEWYTHELSTEKGMSIHIHQARQLGFELKHPTGVFNYNGHTVSQYQPLLVQFVGGALSSARYRECDVCGEDHEALVIAFMDWYRKTWDPHIRKTSEERVKTLEREGLGGTLAQKIADMLSNGLTEDDMDRLLKIGTYRDGSVYRLAVTEEPKDRPQRYELGPTNPQELHAESLDIDEIDLNRAFAVNADEALDRIEREAEAEAAKLQATREKLQQRRKEGPMGMPPPGFRARPGVATANT